VSTWATCKAKRVVFVSLPCYTRMKGFKTPSPGRKPAANPTSSNSSKGGSRRSTPAPDSTIPPSRSTQFVQMVGDWRDLHDSSARIAQEIVNLRGEAVHLTSTRVDEALGAAVKPSRMLAQTYEKLAASVKLLDEKQKEMVQKLEGVTSLALERETAIEGAATTNEAAEEWGDWPWDDAYIKLLTAQLKQQTLLELCAAETLSMRKQGAYDVDVDDERITIDSDTAATLLACWAAMPYLPASSLDLLLR